MNDSLSDGLALPPNAEAVALTSDVVVERDQDIEALVDDGALNLAERFIAQIGAWAGAAAERWCSSTPGPFFASDGRFAADPVLFFMDETAGMVEV